MTDRTAPSSDARKRRHERDMADAHAAARARDAKARAAARHARFMAAIDRILARDPQTAADSTPPPQEDPMPTITRTITVRLDPESMALLTEIRDRLPERTEVKVAPFDPNLVAANIAALKHEVETPMREHGDCCEPDPADDLPGEPVEPGDLRAGDRVAFTWGGERITCDLCATDTGALRTLEGQVDGGRAFVVGAGGLWSYGISDVRLIDRAPREDEEPDEALAMALCSAFWGGQVMPSADNADWKNAARAARERIESEWEEVAKSFEDGRDKWQAEARQQRDRAEQAEAERDALRERLDALRADVERFSAGDPLITPLDILVRDDERAAKGGQR